MTAQFPTLIELPTRARKHAADRIARLVRAGCVVTIYRVERSSDGWVILLYINGEALAWDY